MLEPIESCIVTQELMWLYAKEYTGSTACNSGGTCLDRVTSHPNKFSLYMNDGRSSKYGIILKKIRFHDRRSNDNIFDCPRNRKDIEEATSPSTNLLELAKSPECLQPFPLNIAYHPRFLCAPIYNIICENRLVYAAHDTCENSYGMCDDFLFLGLPRRQT